MKKISLICAVALAGLSLTACGNPSQKKNTTSKQTSSKVVKKHHKKVKRSKKKANKSKHASSSSAVSASNQQNQQQQTQSKQANPADESTWNLPYKGFASYNAYLDYYHGDPDIQRQTAQMQHEENMRKGIEDANGNETQNFKNWVSARDNAWDNGNDNFPDYDQNHQWWLINSYFALCDVLTMFWSITHQLLWKLSQVNSDPISFKYITLRWLAVRKKEW